MSNKITKEEVRNLITKEIKEKDLNEVLSSEVIDKIKDRVVSKITKDKAVNDIPEFVSELDIPSSPGGTREFPDSNELAVSPSNDTGMNDKEGVNIPAGSEPTDTPYEPTEGYTPELPSFLDKVEPGKVIVFDYNELSEGGENLTKKPLRQYDNPDEKKSIHDLWLEEGKRKVEVYQAKFEKIGDLEFDYANGTTRFIENRAPMDYQGEHGGYKENPYVADPQPVLDEPNQMELQKYIQSSVDLEKVVRDVVVDILQSSLKSENYFKSNDFNENIADQYRQANQDNRQIADQQHSSTLRPMEESKSIKMKDLIGEGFYKLETPSALRESIEKGENTYLLSENEEVKTYKFGETIYHTPSNPISVKKSYVKL
jgi:hypothetical protein